MSTAFLWSPLDRVPHTTRATAPLETRMTAGGTSQMTAGGEHLALAAVLAAATTGQLEQRGQLTDEVIHLARRAWVAQRAAHCCGRIQRRLPQDALRRAQHQRRAPLGLATAALGPLRVPAAAHHAQGEGACTKARWQGK